MQNSNDNKYYKETHPYYLCGKRGMGCHGVDNLSKPNFPGASGYRYVTDRINNSRGYYTGPTQIKIGSWFPHYYYYKRKPYNSSYLSTWNPYLSKFNNDKTTTNYLPIKNCCYKGYSNWRCGSLHGGSDGKGTTDCQRALHDYCNANDSHLINPDCLEHIKNNYSLFKDKLKDICANKPPGTSRTWDKLCACHQPKSFYRDINNRLMENCNVPHNAINTNPECVYPSCSSSDFYDKSVVCPPTAFSQCVQNTDINLQDSSIGNVVIDQNADCMAWTRKGGEPVITR